MPLQKKQFVKTIAELKKFLESSLVEYYGQKEAESLSRIVLRHITGYSAAEMILHSKDTLSETDLEKLYGFRKRLLNWEPVQYILGESAFLDIRVKVDPSVLIPRPETEELVLLADRYLNESCKKNLRLLDIGTGSGCIAIALKNMNPDSVVSALDVSEKALGVARENAAMNSAEIDFRKQNILNFEEEGPFPCKFDMIISNPPYVTESDKLLMHKNVLDHEPATALYISDEDPLIFYRKIAEFARLNLADGGVIFLEINENYAEQLKSLYLAFGFPEIEIRKDLSNRDRFAIIHS